MNIEKEKNDDNIEKELNNNNKKFCELYILDWNGTKAYKEVYGLDMTDEIAASNASRLLRNDKVKAYIATIQEDIEKQAGISRLMVVNEYKKLAFSSIAHLHETWIELKEFNTLTEAQKACIQEIQTKTEEIKIGDDLSGKKVVDFVKVKLYDKQKALENIARILGYDAPQKIEHSGEVKQLAVLGSTISSEEWRILAENKQNELTNLRKEKLEKYGV